MRFLFTIAFLLISATAFAADPPEIKTVESYLNGIRTLKSRFVQTSQDGKKMTGTFMLNRPGKLRFEYDLPTEDFIVADGTFIYYYDGQMKQQSSTPISQSLADFFLRKTLKLSGDIGVSDIRREEGLLQLTITQAKDPLAGSLTLFFSENPVQLKRWRIVDAQGLTTKIEIYDSRSGVVFDDEIFHYYDPSKKKAFINK